MMERKKYCVAGEWRDSKTEKWMSVTDSSTGEVIAEVPCCTNDEVEEAIAALKQAMQGDNTEEIKAKTEALKTASYKIAEELYKQQGAAGAGAGVGAGSATGAAGLAGAGAAGAAGAGATGVSGAATTAGAAGAAGAGSSTTAGAAGAGAPGAFGLTGAATTAGAAGAAAGATAGSDAVAVTVGTLPTIASSLLDIVAVLIRPSLL